MKFGSTEYILFIAKHRRLPATLSEKLEAGVKADWQPLYHLVAGLAATPIDLTAPPELKVTWQPATRQLIDPILPRATLVRTEDERPPYQGVYALWQMGRWVSLALGAGTLIVTYFLCLTVWPGHSTLAVGTTALLVFMPRFLFTHAILSDDTMMGFCLALSLLLLVRLIQRSTVSHQLATAGGQKSGNGIYYLLFTGLGVTVGLAIVAKYTAIPAVVGLLVVSAWIARRQRWSWRNWLLGNVAWAGSLTLAVSWWVGWVWWHFNQVAELGPVLGLIKPLLPGASVDDNPTTARLTAFLSGQDLSSLGQASGASGNFLDWLRSTFVTLWGVTVFGSEPHWPYPYWVIMSGVALFCLAAIVGLGRVYRQSVAATRPLGWILMLYVLLFLPIPLLRFALSNRLNDAAQGRHVLFPAGPVIVVLLMTGWLAWFRPQRRNWVALFTGGLMLAWGMSHLFYLGWAYPPPLPVRTTPGPQMQVEHSTQVNFGNLLELIGYQTQLTDNGATLQVDLLWHSLAQAWEDYSTEITLIDQQGQTRLRWQSHPANGRFPVRAWQPGDLVRDTLFIPLAGLAPGEYNLQLRLLGWDKPLSSSQGETIVLTRVESKTAPAWPQVTLWQQGKVVRDNIPTYRYRSTIPVTWAEGGMVSLIGPAGQVYSPTSTSGYLQLFIVDYAWPSGNYHLQVDNWESGTSLRVENFSRNFSLPAMMYPVQANFANKIELLGYDLPDRRAEAGSGIPLVLYWRGLTQMREDYTIFVQLLDASLQRRGGYDRFPRENYPTYLWVPGEIVDDGFAVPVAANAPAGVYSVRLGWYHIENGQAVSLPLMQAGHPLAETSVVISPIKIGGPPPGVVTPIFLPEHPLNVNLGEIIALRGYDLKLQERAIQLKLYWQSVAQTNIDYTVFVHIRDQAGVIVAQLDSPPAAGKYPTSLWDKGEVIPDTFTLDVPSAVKPALSQLVVGLYDAKTGSRLAVPGSGDNSVLLTKFGHD